MQLANDGVRLALMLTKGKETARSDFEKTVIGLLAHCYNTIGGIYYHKTDYDYDKATEFFLKALKIREEIDDKMGVGSCYYNIALVHSSKGEYDEGLKFHFKALEFYGEICGEKNFLTETECKHKIATSYNTIGGIYFDKGNYDEALKIYFEELKIYERLLEQAKRTPEKSSAEIARDKNGMATSYSSIASIYTEKLDYGKALDFYFKALQLHQQICGKESLTQATYCWNRIADTYNYIGNIYFKQTEDDKALEFYFKALKIMEEIEARNGRAVSYNSIGNIYSGKGDYNKASEFYFRALKLFEELGEKAGMSLLHNNIGDLFLKQNKPVDAKKYLEKSLSIAKEINAKPNLMNAYFSLTICDSIMAASPLSPLQRKGELWKSALQYHQLYSAMKDSIFNEKSNKVITEMQTKYETTEKEKKIELLNKENEVKDERLQKQNTIRNSIIGIAALLIAVVILLYNRRQLKLKNIYQQKINAQQKALTKAVIDGQEQERERVAKELHDGLGTMMASARLNLNSVEKKVNDLPEIKNDLRNVLGILDKATKDTRSIAHNLMPPSLTELGLAKAIEELVSNIQRSGALEAKFISFGNFETLDNSISVSLYRIAQEMLNNCLKHSQAKKLEMQLIRHENSILLMIEDNGKGFDKEKIKQNGMGLNNLKARAELLNGNLQVDSVEGKGTSITVEVPIK